MATINASEIAQSYTTYDAGAADFAAYASHSTAAYSWLTSDGHRITAMGSGITVDGANSPTAGTITSLTLDLGDTGGTADITITDLAFDLTSLAFAAGQTATNQFWSTVLSGTDSISDGAGAALSMGGDFAHITQMGSYVAGNDSFTGGGVDNTTAHGDGADISMGTLTGGHDSFSGAFDIAVGDVRNLSGGAEVTGGHDTMVLTLDWTADRSFSLFGDAISAGNTARLFGGNDVLDGRGSTTEEGDFFGDLLDANNNARLTGGDDTIWGSAQGDDIYADLKRLTDQAELVGGDDTVWGGAGDDRIWGDVADDISSGAISGGRDVLYGDGGADTLYGNRGRDSLFGGAGADQLFGEEREDALFGGSGDDALYGGTRADYLEGGTGDDSLDGASRSDVLYGGDDKDRLDGGGAADDLYGGAGADTLTGGNGDDFLSGDAGGDDLIGGRDSDTLWGGSGDDSLKGGRGADDLAGDAGDDILQGQRGADRLKGGLGNDTLTGAEGVDTFVYDGDSAGGIDQITDFENGTEVIEITGTTTFADITINQSGPDTEITFGATTIFLLAETGPITQDDFLFV